MFLTRRRFIVNSASMSLAALSARANSDSRPAAKSNTFVCPPCGCSMDENLFDRPGLCSACNMVLMPRISHSLGHQPSGLKSGAGRFTLEGRTVSKESRITVDYFLPRDVGKATGCVIVLPGAGRNSDTYRNMWLPAAYEKELLVLALSYPESPYDFAAYHMGGLIRDLSLHGAKRSKKGRTTIIEIDDADMEFNVNPDTASWLFNDFDRVFEFVTQRLQIGPAGYDLFGHSAGGQLLQRMALTHGASKAQRIVAANAGFYTLPNLHESLPTGLSGLGITEQELDRAFSQRLILLLGEQDDSPTAGGTLLLSDKVNQQGLGRLQRGKHFFNVSAGIARARATEFNWVMQTVPNVGHNGYRMSQAAAHLLYGTTLKY